MKRLFQKLNIDQVYTAYAETYEQNFCFEGEYHAMWELAVIRSGSAGITSGTEIYDCSEGDIVIHPAGIFHNVWEKESKEVRILTVSFTGSGTEHLVPCGKYRLNQNERVIADLLEKEVAHNAPGWQGADTMRLADDGQMLKNLLEVLFLSLNRRRAESSAPSNDHNAALFVETVHYLEEHADEALTVATICTEMAVGRTTLKNLFKTYTGSGVMRYYNTVRIKRAVALIETGLSMAEVAERMHFSSQNYFSTFFKRETGKSPKSYFSKE
ncbi:MAG: helix-turn-helix transcriptional regulator [Ruminococcaceae bacterium]|nr:helix-turn-helix transcriptional regulator [Oscillospiraceae bacterium]